MMITTKTIGAKLDLEVGLLAVIENPPGEKKMVAFHFL